MHHQQVIVNFDVSLLFCSTISRNKRETHKKLIRRVVVSSKLQIYALVYFKPSALVNYSEMETRKPTRCIENVSPVFLRSGVSRWPRGGILHA